MDDDNLYDEFGNYIGPDLDGEEDMLADQYQQQQEEEEQDMEEEIRDEDRIVLHEDKQYYPEMDEVYPEAENLVMEEDAQHIDEPIINPIKQKDFDYFEKIQPDCVFSSQYLQDIMKFPSLIRNVGVVGHLHHGKTSLLDMFIQEGILKDWKQDKEYKYMDCRKDENERLISIKSKPITLVMPDTKGKSHYINFFDTPGHVNFSDEICCALRVCDGVILVVDAIEGVMLGTERLISYLVHQRIAITLFINKLDRLICELKLPPSDSYLKIRHTIEEVNSLVQQYASEHGLSEAETQKMKLSPLLGNVLFGSGFYQFSFSLKSFSEMYAYSYKLEKSTFEKVLWGNIYYDRKQRKFVKQASKDFSKRTFVEFILEPIYKIFSHTVSKDQANLKPLLHKLGIYLKQNQFRSDTKPLLKTIFKNFFGKSNFVVDMLTTHIPSAQDGTKKKVEMNYTGARDNEFYQRMLQCDPNGPLVINIVKQFNRPDCQNFDVFGRIISGTLKQLDTVKVLGENFNIEDEEDMAVKVVKNIYVYQSRFKMEVKEASAGAWVLIDGIDQSISKSATVINANEKFQVEIFRPIRHNTISVIKLAIEPLIPSELPKMLEGLRKINKSYPLLTTKVEESGEHILIGTGELYLDCVLHDLRRMYSEIEIKVSDPSVSFCETVLETSQIKCYAETPNKKNKLTMLANPIDKGLGEDIEKENVNLQDGKKKVSQFFREKYNWDILAARSVWSFGPTFFGPNILIDDTLPSEVDKAQLDTCKETIVQGFKWATREGPLCDEPIRNVKFRIIEANLANEPIFRGGGQIIPTARRTCYSSFLMATPRIMEPQFYVEIQCTQDALEAVYVVIGRRRGHIIQEQAKAGSPLYTVKANIPAIDSFGFETDLRVHTSGQAFCLQVFHQWEMLPGDPLDKNIKLNLLEPSETQDLAREFMIKTRRRKGLNENVSIVKYFDDQDLLEQLKQDKDFKSYI